MSGVWLFVSYIAANSSRFQLCRQRKQTATSTPAVMSHAQQKPSTPVSHWAPTITRNMAAAEPPFLQVITQLSTTVICKLQLCAMNCHGQPTTQQQPRNSSCTCHEITQIRFCCHGCKHVDRLCSKASGDDEHKQQRLLFSRLSHSLGSKPQACPVLAATSSSAAAPKYNDTQWQERHPKHACVQNRSFPRVKLLQRRRPLFATVHSPAATAG